jgi:hypothetical protein
MNAPRTPPSRFVLMLPVTVPLALLVMFNQLHRNWPTIPDGVDSLVHFGSISHIRYSILVGGVLTYVSACVAWVYFWKKRVTVPYERWLNGLCPRCAYDLRAHKAGDRCPECGTIIPQRPSRGRAEGTA